jgi:methanogenic corrinoid protein MtbC1
MLAKLVYRSRATHPLSQAELHQLTVAAQSRNLCESITGLVVYDDSQFFQWLEGPAESLQRIMDSIRNDPRHTDIEVLENETADTRRFSDWSMKLAVPPLNPLARQKDVIDAPAEVIAELREHPEAAPTVLVKLMPRSFGVAENEPVTSDKSAKAMLYERTEVLLQTVIRTTVIPIMVERDRTLRGYGTASVVIPRLAEFADLLLGSDATRAMDLVEVLRRDSGASFSLYGTLFEPAARLLGDLWSEDRCSEFDVTVGLCRLQTAARLCGSDATAPHALADAPIVLVAPEPGELHGLSAALDSEVMWAAGWAPQSAFPASDKALQDMLAANWFDVLDLSLSAAFTREDWLPRMARTIDLARFASRNPALVVVVGGRIFAEQEGAGQQVGADVASTTAHHVDDVILEAVGVVQRARPERRKRIASSH